MYYRRANAALIVFDITREKTFDEAKEWVRGKQSRGSLFEVALVKSYLCTLCLQNWRVKWTPNLVSELPYSGIVL